MKNKEIKQLALKQFVRPFRTSQGEIYDGAGKKVATMIYSHEKHQVNNLTDKMVAQALTDYWNKEDPPPAPYRGRCWRKGGMYPPCTCGPKQCWERNK
ncbi:MAG: hypothetical protein R3332_00305 [Pseudohongiellaceae bacterium]|nr:hypothetical protein [Pseudohongiellaceae bacterium]